MWSGRPFNSNLNFSSRYVRGHLEYFFGGEGPPRHHVVEAGSICMVIIVTVMLIQIIRIITIGSQYKLQLRHVYCNRHLMIGLPGSIKLLHASLKIPLNYLNLVQVPLVLSALHLASGTLSIYDLSPLRIDCYRFQNAPQAPKYHQGRR